MSIKVLLDDGAILPTKAHPTDAGFDLYSRDYCVIKPNSSATFDTGVHIELPLNTVGFLKSKSGLNVKLGIVGEGVIDCGYTGSIVVKLYNHSESEVEIQPGFKISQLVILPIINDELQIVDNLKETERGDKGFGSSGK